MRHRATRIIRTAATISIAASLTVGAGAAAFAQPADAPAAPAVPGSSTGAEAVEGVTDAVTAGERVQIGENIKADGLYDVLYEVALFKQLTSGAKVSPGEEVTMRLEAEGVQGVARVGQLHNSMPAGFELVSVARVEKKDGAETVTKLGSEDYRFRDNGAEGSTVEVTFGGSPYEHPQIRTGETVTLEYVYRAPQELGTYEHGGRTFLSWVPSGYPMNGGAATGAQPIEVVEAPVAPPAGSAGIDWDSILGSLGLDSVDLGSLNQGDGDE
ncbi:hypothetical protein ACFWGD_10885 [Corynebacterium sp. NPDC060344]|uniref:hypothetical protein n=1 Tax=Corynebacterium sp. NPDC060344 TaxID=3347101 RepID=UPI00365823C1